MRRGSAPPMRPRPRARRSNDRGGTARCRTATAPPSAAASVRPTALEARQKTHRPLLPSSACLTLPRGVLLAEQALGPEDEDHDQDREDDRTASSRARRVPGEALDEGLDQADEEPAEHSAPVLPIPPSTAAVNA